MNAQREKANVEEFVQNKLSKQAKTYVSRRPGYTLTLPPGLTLNNGKSRIVFDSYAGREFTTRELPIQDFLETHPKFGQPGLPNKNGVQTEFYYSPTPEELAAERAAIEARKQIEFIKTTPGLKLNLVGYSKTQLVQLAIQLNVPVFENDKDGNQKERNYNSIRDEIQALFDGDKKAEEEEPKK